MSTIPPNGGPPSGRSMPSQPPGQPAPPSAAVPPAAPPIPGPTGRTTVGTSWQDGGPGRQGGLSRQRQIFLLLCVLALLGGATLALILYLQRPPAATFVPVVITEYTGAGGLAQYGRLASARAAARADRAALIDNVSWSTNFPWSRAEQAQNLDNNQTQALLRQFLTAQLRSQTLDNPTLVVYLCAYGLQRDGRVYLLPGDASPDKAETWIDLQNLFTALGDAAEGEEGRAAAAKNKVLLLDLMRPLADPRLGVLANDVAQQAIALAREAVNANPRLTVLTACGPGQVSWVDEDQGRSVFGLFLERGLRGDADGVLSNGDKDNRVFVRELATYLERNVDRWARRNRGPGQRPVLITSPDFQDFALIQYRAEEPADAAPMTAAASGTAPAATAPAATAPAATATAPVTPAAAPVSPAPAPAGLPWTGAGQKAPEALVREVKALIRRFEEEPAGDKAAQEKKTQERLAQFKAFRDPAKGPKPADLERAVFQAAVEDPAPTAWTLVLYAELVTDPEPNAPRAQFLETVFLQELARAVRKAGWSDTLGRVARTALRVVRDSQNLLAGDPRPFPWLGGRVRAALVRRRAGEVFLFNTNAFNLAQADREFTQAARGIQEAQAAAEVLTAAYLQADRASRELPILFNAILDRVDRGTGDGGLEVAWAEAARLAANLRLDLRFDPARPDREVPADLGRRVGALRDQLDQLHEEAQKQAAGEAAGEAADEKAAIELEKHRAERRYELGRDLTRLYDPAAALAEKPGPDGARALLARWQAARDQAREGGDRRAAEARDAWVNQWLLYTEADLDEPGNTAHDLRRFVAEAAQGERLVKPQVVRAEGKRDGGQVRLNLRLDTPPQAVQEVRLWLGAADVPLKAAGGEWATAVNPEQAVRPWSLVEVTEAPWTFHLVTQIPNLRGLFASVSAPAAGPRLAFVEGAPDSGALSTAAGALLAARRWPVIPGVAKRLGVYVLNPTEQPLEGLQVRLSLGGVDVTVPNVRLKPQEFVRVTLPGTPGAKEPAWKDLTALRPVVTLLDAKGAELDRADDLFDPQPAAALIDPARTEVVLEGNGVSGFQVKATVYPRPGLPDFGSVPVTLEVLSLEMAESPTAMPVAGGGRVPLAQNPRAVRIQADLRAGTTPIVLVQELAGRPPDLEKWRAYLKVGSRPRALIYKLNGERDLTTAVHLKVPEPAFRSDKLDSKLTFRVEGDNLPAGAVWKVTLEPMDAAANPDAVRNRELVGANQRLGRVQVAEGGGLLIEVDERDWEEAVPVYGLAGRYRLRARVAKVEPIMLATTVPNLVLDATPPQVTILPLASPFLPPDQPVALEAVAEDPESGIRELNFFLGEPPADGLDLPKEVKKEAAELRRESGKYVLTMPLPDGTRYVNAQAINGAGIPSYARLPVKVGKGLEALGAKPTGISGVLREGPRGQDNREVHLYDEKGTAEVAKATTDANGAFTFKDLKPGKYIVFAEKKESRRAARKNVTVPAGEVVPVDLDLRLK